MARNIAPRNRSKSLNSNLAPNAGWEQDFREIKRSASIQVWASLVSRLMFCLMSAILLASAFRLIKQEARWETLSGKLQDVALQSDNLVKDGNELLQEISPPDSALAVTDHQSAEGKHDRIGTRLENTQQMLHEVRKKQNLAKDLNDKLSQAEKSGKDLAKQQLMQISRLEGEKKTLEGEKKTLEGEKKTLESKRKALEGEKMALEGEKKTLQNEKKALEGEKTALLDKVKNDAPKPGPNANVKPAVAEVTPRPDPDLATLIVIIDSDTNFIFLQSELIDLYTYHNFRAKNAEVVGVDVWIGTGLRSGYMIAPQQQSLNQLSMPKFFESLEQSGDKVANVEQIPPFLSNFFTSIDKRKKKQLILIAGADCSAPALDSSSWNAVEYPVHVCIVGDKRPLTQNFQANWQSFTKSKKGEFVLIEVDFRSLAEKALGRSRVKHWLEGRL